MAGDAERRLSVLWAGWTVGRLRAFVARGEVETRPEDLAELVEAAALALAGARERGLHRSAFSEAEVAIVLDKGFHPRVELAAQIAVFERVRFLSVRCQRSISPCICGWHEDRVGRHQLTSLRGAILRFVYRGVSGFRSVKPVNTARIFGR